MSLTREAIATLSNDNAVAYARKAYPDHWMVQHLCDRLDASETRIANICEEWSAVHREFNTAAGIVDFAHDAITYQAKKVTP